VQSTERRSVYFYERGMSCGSHFLNWMRDPPHAGRFPPKRKTRTKRAGSFSRTPESDLSILLGANKFFSLPSREGDRLESVAAVILTSGFKPCPRLHPSEERLACGGSYPVTVAQPFPIFTGFPALPRYGGFALGNSSPPHFRFHKELAGIE